MGTQIITGKGAIQSKWLPHLENPQKQKENTGYGRRFLTSGKEKMAIAVILAVCLAGAAFYAGNNLREQRRRRRETARQNVLAFAELYRRQLAANCSPQLGTELALEADVSLAPAFRKGPDIATLRVRNTGPFPSRQLLQEFRAGFARYLSRPENRQLNMRIEIMEEREWHQSI